MNCQHLKKSRMHLAAKDLCSYGHGTGRFMLFFTRCETVSFTDQWTHREIRRCRINNDLGIDRGLRINTAENFSDKRELWLWPRRACRWFPADRSTRPKRRRPKRSSKSCMIHWPKNNGRRSVSTGITWTRIVVCCERDSKITGRSPSPRSRAVSSRPTSSI